MQNQVKISILIVDDQELFAENLKLALETLAPDLEVVGIAVDGQEAIDRMPDLAVDLVLMDVRMPRLDGVQATKILHSRYPTLKIVMLTTFLDDTYVQDALTYGAYGYLLKNIQPADLVASIRAVSGGSVLFSPDILARLIPMIEAHPAGSDVDKEYQAFYTRLGRREKEILRLVAKGLSNTKIAEQLFISEPTVRNYISSIYAKFGSKDRLELISFTQKAHGGKNWKDIPGIDD